MDIRTSQDVALIWCGPCMQGPSEAPRKECQSITVAACGFSLPDLTTVPAEDRCKMFRKRTESFFRSSSFSDTFEGGTYTDNESGTTTVTFQNDYVTIGEGEEAVRTCTARQFSTSYNFTDTETTNLDDEEEEDSSTTATYSSSSGIDSPCSGTFTIVSTGAPDDSGDFNVCPLPGVGEATEDFTYSTLGIFTFSETYDSFGTTISDTLTVTYSELVTIASLEAEIEVRKTMLAGANWPGGECSSSVEFIYGHEDPPEIPEPPPDPPEPVPELAIVCEQVGSVTKARYRFGIPSGERWEATASEWLAWDADDPGTRGPEPLKTTQDVAHAAWVIEHAAWTAAAPETRGEEPIEPTPRSVYEIQFDEGFFSSEWTSWKVLKDAFDAETAAHAAWVAGGSVGPEPDVSADPGAEPTAPTLVASRSWIYAADEWSPWYEMAVPTEAGETRIVNMQSLDRRSSAIGQKPTAHGEVYEF